MISPVTYLSIPLQEVILEKYEQTKKRGYKVKFICCKEKYRIFPIPTIVITKPVKDLCNLYTKEDTTYYGVEITIRFLRYCVGVQLPLKKDSFRIVYERQGTIVSDKIYPNFTYDDKGNSYINTITGGKNV